MKLTSTAFTELERAMGIEPTPKAWEASVLPLNYARKLFSCLLFERPFDAPLAHLLLFLRAVLYARDKLALHSLCAVSLTERS